ncbi:MAG: nucleoside recognition domain-containing protein, partial [Acutalibacteraceae bacterium]
MRLKCVFLSILSVSLIILILLFPVQTLQGAKNGLSAFALSVVPALFPFFVATGLFTKLGTATRFSTALRPLMRPLFGLPGQSALPVFLSVVSGYPNGARATAALYEAKQLTQTQARRTMVYASTAGPSFVISVLAASLLG